MRYTKQLTKNLSICRKYLKVIETQEREKMQKRRMMRKRREQALLEGLMNSLAKKF